ncbi:MAG: roadblock/LC7 domain-containing protein [Carbonactinosporaceae bacterium]
MQTKIQADDTVQWLLDKMVDAVPEMLLAVLLSRDGLAIACSRDVKRDDAEQLAAMASGLHGLAMGVQRRFNGGRVQQTVVQSERRYVLVAEAGDGARVAVLASESVDAGMMAYQAHTLVQKVGDHLGAASRADTPHDGENA